MSQTPSPLPPDEASPVLLVDDDATNLDVLRQTLEGRGYRLFVARNGEDALKVARRARPLLVLLDVVMPGIDGYETCRRLKDDPETRDSAVIFLSSLDDAKDKVRGFEAGAVDFITKPFGGDEVRARVDTHLTIQRLLRRQLDARSASTPVKTPDAEGTRRRPVEGRKPPSDSPPNAVDLGAGGPEAGLESLPFDDLSPDPGGSVFRPGEVVAYRFRIVRYLAKGGMGELYEAEDLELHERVALKTILSRIAEDERSILQFKREVHLARQVTHPNVCRIFDVFRHRPQAAAGAEGQAPEVVFLAMEFLHGETLADRLGRDGRLATAEVLLLARQMAAGLSAAHRVGVVHRDFKSHNVMLVAPTPPDQDVRAVITDFGLAQRSSADDRSSLSISLNDAGEISGTPAYMAPEQVEGGPVTSGTDLYAFGVVLFEMVTGVRPFVADTPLKIAVKRLQEPAPTPRVHVPDLDPRWEATILRCLARQPADRFASVGEVVAALEEQRVEPGVTDRRRRLWPIGVPIIAIGVLALGFGAWRLRSHRAPALSATDTIVLVDFSNSTGDAVFDDTLKQGLATSLQQSPFFNVLPDRTVRETLMLMGHSLEERLTPEAAQELCQRAGGKAVLMGSIASLGSKYVIGLTALDCQSGASLARQTAEAGKKEDVLGTLDRAATKLRETVGESLSSIQKYDTPIAQATTPSLDALKAYSSGVKANSEKGATAAIPLYKRAIDLDPGFAMAYASLGNAYVDLREYGLATESFQKAYDLRSKVSEREKFALSAYYYTNVTGELEKAIQTYELWAHTYPQNWVPHNNLGVSYTSLGQYAKALAETLEAIRLNPDSGLAYGNLVGNYCHLNRLGEAKAAYQQALTRKLERPSLHYNMYGVAFLEGDTAEMDRQVAWGAGKAGAEHLLLSHQSDTRAFSGQLGKARDLSRGAVQSALRAGETEAAAQEQLNGALREAEFGNAAKAREETTSALALASTANVRILAALALARTGDLDRAQKMADEAQKQSPLHTKINRYWLPTIRAAIETNRGDPSKAIEILQAAAPSELGIPDPQPEVGGMLYPVYIRGQAYLSLQQGSAAAAEFQKFLDHEGAVINCPLGSLARLGLARAYALQGDSAKARAGYDDFLTLWKDADPDIPILQRARAEYAKLK
jgi:eukaryotic-like serine/threonine-protein kinase